MRDPNLNRFDDKKYGRKVPENYERFFVPAISAPLAYDLITQANLRRGERVLDAACGTGTVTRLAFEHVAPSGTTTGLDINPGMLAVARSATADSPIDWHEASAEEMPFANEEFDVVLCQLSLQFMTDKIAALKEMHRVLRVGGRLFLNVPGPAGPLFVILVKAMGRYVSTEAGNFVTRVFSLHDPDTIRELLKKAGFEDIKIQAIKKKLALPSPKQFLGQYISSTPLAGLLSGVDDKTYTRLEQEVTEGWSHFTEKGTLSYMQRILTVGSRK